MDYMVGAYLAGLGIVDMRTKRLPLWIVAVGCIGSGIYCVAVSGLAVFILGALPGIVLLIISLFAPMCLGAGDGLIAVIYGLLYGWRRTCIWLMIGFWIAALFGVVMRMIQKRQKISIPFIPFLAIVHVGMLL